MLQRVREACQGRQVNLIHRLDRGASGCLLLSFAAGPATTTTKKAKKQQKKKNPRSRNRKGSNSNNSTSNSTSTETKNIHEEEDDENDTNTTNANAHTKDMTAVLQQRMTSSSSSSSEKHDETDPGVASMDTTKTYIALVRGEGILHGRDFTQEGWFAIHRPIKNEKGVVKKATSYFRFLAGQAAAADDDETDEDTGPDNTIRRRRPRASLVLCRIHTGRWHQIRKHLNGLSHPIIGDSSHGNSQTNREWRQQWGLPSERTCLHLLQINLPASTNNNADDDDDDDDGDDACNDDDSISVIDPLPHDMMTMLQQHFTAEFWNKTNTALREEGLYLTPPSNTNNAEDDDTVIRGRSRDSSYPKIVPVNFIVSR